MTPDPIPFNSLADSKPALLDNYLAADGRRERWRVVGLLVAFSIMTSAGLILSFLGGKGKPLSTVEYCLLAVVFAPWVVYTVVFALWRRSAIFAIPLRCPTCGAAIGDLHVLGCTLEECPFCGGQVACCGCIRTVLGLTANESECLDSAGDDSVDPLKSVLGRWGAALKRKGRMLYGPRWFTAEITRDGVAIKPTLGDIKIAGDVATAEFRTRDGRSIKVAFRRIKQGWMMKDE